jgi:nitrite reductase (NADH) small subunit
MSGFAVIARLERIAPGTSVVATIDGNPVAVFNVEGSLFAHDDSCLLCGSSLAAGRLRAALVSCSGCRWGYDVRTGCVCGLPELRIDTYEVRIRGPLVLVATPLTPITR